MSSSLGQPLSAEIELVSLQPGEFEVLVARVASPEAYTDARIEYSPLLRQLRFTVERKADGKPVLKITSGAPINEPFIDVLVEVTWPSGRLVREYPILLDPPGFNEARIQAPVAAVVAPRAPTTTQIPAAPEGSSMPSARAESVPKGDTYGPVKRGDTLAKIASEMKGDGVSLDQMLVALFRENKQAFGSNNMNVLKTGQILRIPTASEVAKITKDEAQKEVRVQVADWKSYREQVAGTVAAAAAKPAASNVATGQVTAAKPAVPPSVPATDQLKIARAETAAPAGATGAKGGADAAKSAAKEDAVAKEKALAESRARIAELEKQKADAQKLLQLKAAPVPAPAPAPATASGAAAKPAQVAQATPVPAAPAAAAAPLAATPDVAAKPVVPAKPAAKAPPPPPPEPQLMDTLMDNLPIIAGVGVGVLGIGGLFAFMRRRKKAGGGGATTRTSSLMPSDLKPNTVTGAKAGGLVDTGNSSFLTDFDKAGPGAIDTDEVDPVAEAEVYIAYGRDAQAEEILKEAMTRDKGRHEISMKLLEIYHARKSAPAFETVAQQLKNSVGEGDPMWSKAAAMGASIDPSNSLYSGVGGNFEPTGAFGAGGDAVAAAAAEADAKPDLDFDLGFDDSATTKMPAQAIDITAPATDQPEPAADAGLDFDLDLGAGTSDVPTTAVDSPSESTGLDFDLALDSPAEATPAAAAGSAPSAAPASSGFDFDLSALSLDEPSAAVDLSVAPAKPVSAAPSLDLSDLSLDLDSPGDAGSATPSAGVDPGAVATKLELAKAYVEIGDADGAKEILNEVAREGSVAQQQEAKTILAGL